VRLRCRFDDSLPEPPRIDVVLAMPRPKILKRLWPQLSAIGVGRIFIVNASKVEGNYFATHWLEPEFYRPLLLEGLEQCVHTFVPEVGVRRRLKPFLEDEAGTLFRDYLRIAGDPHGAPVSGIKSGGHRAVIAVGPEGGWSEYEAAMLGGCGFAMMSAGSRILRSDTACIALIAAVQSVMDRGL
jgi:RsmE family RNA methyltransferase